MIQLQILSKVLQSQDNSIIEDNLLTVDDFVGYEKEFNFIEDHYAKYGNVPDKATFLSEFPTVDLVDVAETDNYLITKIREESLYYKSVPVVKKVAELLKTDANLASEYMLQAVKELQPNYNLGGLDIVNGAESRFEAFLERKSNPDEFYYTTGFKELDSLVNGIQREEELFVIFARTNQGKSWVLEKMCTHVWQLGYNVGYVSPEMGANSIGYRFDTLYKNFSNRALTWGKDDVDENEYKNYIEGLKGISNKFMVATPNDFSKQITVSRLRNWIKQHNLDLIAIDGITYMTDERGKRGDNKTTSLTNISEDLMSLSMELGVPVMVVVQANRNGAVDVDSDDVPSLESIRDSDGIAHNASKVLSMRQTKDGVLKLEVKKQRNGVVGGKLNYQWDINTGQFTFIPDYNDAEPTSMTENRLTEFKNQMHDIADVF